MNKLKREWIPAALSVALLGAIGLGRWLGPSPVDAEPYHAAVRQAVHAMPMQVGSWVGTEEPLVAAAIDLLQPNVAIHRSYRNIESGVTASFLLVQCKDARDLAGHYPPICYPAQGWRMDHQAAGQWNCDGLVLDGKEYGFSYGTVAGAQRIAIVNFMLLPDGSTAPDMEAVRRVAADYKRRFFGAAQVQIVMDARLPAQQRDEVVRALAQASSDVFRLILSGDQP